MSQVTKPLRVFIAIKGKNFLNAVDLSAIKIPHPSEEAGLYKEISLMAMVQITHYRPVCPCFYRLAKH